MTNRAQSERRKRWWASMTPEQRQQHAAKQSAGRAVAFVKRRQLEREWFRKIGIPAPRGHHAP